MLRFLCNQFVYDVCDWMVHESIVPRIAQVPELLENTTAAAVTTQLRKTECHRKLEQNWTMYRNEPYY